MNRRAFLATGAALPASSLASSAPAPKIEFRNLGKTGLRVSALGFGCMTTTDPAVIEKAADIGINYFDTARSYQNGNNERMVGAALKGKRKQITLSTKSLAKTRQEALDQLDTSLRELQTDYVDIWYLHNRNTPEEVPDELLEAQRIARKAGKMRFAGITFHFNMQDMLPWCVKRAEWDVALVAHNFTMKPDIARAIETAHPAGLGIVAMKVLAGGYARIQKGDRLYGMNPGALTTTLKQEGAMLAALKWSLKSKSVDTAIVCMTDFDQLDENLRVMAEPFTPKDEKVLAAQLAAISPIYCRMCGACTGHCEKGAAVSDTLRVLTYAEGYGQFALARERYLELPGAPCNTCSTCSVDCPNGVRVRDRLLRAHELFA